MKLKLWCIPTRPTNLIKGKMNSNNRVTDIDCIVRNIYNNFS